MHHVEGLLHEAQLLSEESSDLSLDGIFRTIKKSIETFYVSATNLKWFWNNFATKDLTESNSKLHYLLIAFYKLDEKIMQQEEWEHIDSVGPSSEGFTVFCVFCCDFIRENSGYYETILQIMERIDSPEAEKTIERINREEQQRKIKEKEEQRKLQAQKKKSSNTGCGCLIFIVLFFVFVFVVGNAIK